MGYQRRVHGGTILAQLSTDREPKASTINSNMIKILATLFAVFHVTCGVPSRGYGHGLVHPFHGPPPCAKEEEVITVTKCSLVPEKTCSTETIVVGEKITGYERGSAKKLRCHVPQSSAMDMDIMVMGRG